jgi:uncharacterized protein YecT (DUF1311 family)
MKCIARFSLMLFVMSAVAADDASLVRELSRKTLLPESDLRVLLSDCNDTQLAMNICAARDSLKADIEMRSTLKALEKKLPSCATRVKSSQAEWDAEMGTTCAGEAYDAVENGTMFAQVYNQCMTKATLERSSKLAGITSCKNLPK